MVFPHSICRGMVELVKIDIIVSYQLQFVSKIARYCAGALIAYSLDRAMQFESFAMPPDEPGVGIEESWLFGRCRIR